MTPPPMTTTRARTGRFGWDMTGARSILGARALARPSRSFALHRRGAERRDTLGPGDANGHLAAALLDRAPARRRRDGHRLRGGRYGAPRARRDEGASPGEPGRGRPLQARVPLAPGPAPPQPRDLAR